MGDKGKSRLSRRIHPIPDDVATAIDNAGVLQDFLARPPYQQNDYVGWIARAKRDETREKRLQQMIDELRQGGVYMNMDHPPSRKSWSQKFGTVR